MHADVMVGKRGMRNRDLLDGHVAVQAVGRGIHRTDGGGFRDVAFRPVLWHDRHFDS